MTSQESRENMILDALPAKELEQLRQDLVPIQLKFGDVLVQTNEMFTHAYFPRGGVISSVTVLDEGRTVEAGTVGYEGMVGLPIVLGGVSANQYLVQVDGPAHRISAEALRRNLAECPTLQRLIGLYANAYMGLLAQTAGCNAVHDVDERCARWLLAMQDRTPELEELPLTQEFLATLIGVHRPTVTLAIGALQQGGLVRYRRGFVTIADREGLESIACECYETNFKRLRSIFGEAPQHAPREKNR